jgi:hypothetical protein
MINFTLEDSGSCILDSMAKSLARAHLKSNPLLTRHVLPLAAKCPVDLFTTWRCVQLLQIPNIFLRRFGAVEQRARAVFFDDTSASIRAGRALAPVPPGSISMAERLALDRRAPC